MGVKYIGLKVTITDLEVKMAVTDGFENGQPLLSGSTNEQLGFRLLHRTGNYRLCLAIAPPCVNLMNYTKKEAKITHTS
jgi:hypothetical protein